MCPHDNVRLVSGWNSPLSLQGDGDGDLGEEPGSLGVGGLGSFCWFQNTAVDSRQEWGPGTGALAAETRCQMEG